MPAHPIKLRRFQIATKPIIGTMLSIGGVGMGLAWLMAAIAMSRGEAAPLNPPAGPPEMALHAAIDQPPVTAQSAFLADPDLPKLRSLAAAQDWPAMQQLAKTMAIRHPGASSAHLYFGVSLCGLKLYEQAEIAFMRGLDIAPENPDLWRGLGTVQCALTKTREARESLMKSAAIAPGIALTWRYLAHSYLNEGDYLEAVPSLEMLRKLDRANFERLLAGTRAMSDHSPRLQTVIRHFDTMPKDELPATPDPVPVPVAAPAPVDPKQLANTLVSAFLSHGEGPDVQAEVDDYAATVDPYFDQGRQTRPAILKDLTTYRAQWPQQTLKLVSIASATLTDANLLEATFRLTYSATDGKRTRTGTLIQTVRFTLTNGRWLVTGIHTVGRVAGQPPERPAKARDSVKPGTRVPAPNSRNVY